MKKNIIRIISFAMAICMCLGLVSCAGFAPNSGTDAASGPASSGATTPFTPPMPPIDFGTGLADNGYWDGVKALDYVTLPQYKGLEIPADEITPTAEDIQKVKDNMVSSFGTATQVTEGETKSGDTVNIDYVGSVDGVEFTGGNTQGQGNDLTLGSGQFIPGFEDQLVGKQVGETVEVRVTFPDGYNDSTDKDGNTVVLANKEALFVTTINYIAGEMVYPEFNDEFVSANLQGQYGWKTVADMEAAVTADMTESNKYDWIETYLNDNATITEVPASIVDSLIYLEFENMKASIAMYGMSVEDYLTSAGFADEEAFKAELKKNLDPLARIYLIFQAIAETEGISPDEAMAQEILGDQLTQLKDQFGDKYTNQYVLYSAVQKILMENN